MYSEAQWAWVGARWAEGYRMTEISEFLGMGDDAARQNLCRCGYRRVPKGKLVPLSERKDEFNALWDKEEL